jgi:hypothetical protein
MTPDIATTPERAVRTPALVLGLLSATSLLVTAVAMAFTLVLFFFRKDGPVAEVQALSTETQMLIRLAWECVLLGTNGLSLAGAFHMHNLRRYRLARAGAIVACIPCISACLCLGIPAGLWAWATLNRPEVEAAFRGGVEG